MIRKKLLTLTALGVLMCVFTTTCKAQFVVDSGTPDGSGTLSVSATLVPLERNQFLAQEFTLDVDTNVSQIEAYLVGNSFRPDFHIYLTRGIGLGTTTADVVDDFLIQPPSGGDALPVWTDILFDDLSLSAGTYYLIFATDEADFGLGLPVTAPNDIGQSFTARGLGIDFDLPPASDFSPTFSDSVFGVRVTGVPTASVPEPSSLMLGVAAAMGFLVRRKR